MASLFPAYSTSRTTSNQSSNEDDKHLDWLQNASYTSHNVDALASIIHATPNEGQEKDVKAEPVEEPLLDQRKEDSSSRHKRKKRSRSSSRSKVSGTPDLVQQSQIPIESHCKKIFIEDIGLKPEHAFRIDRKSDRNNLAFSSFTHSQIAKYVRSLPCLGGGYELNQWWQESSKKSRKNNQDWNKRYHKCIKLIYDETNILDLSQTTKTTNEELCSTLKYTFLPFDLLYSSKNNENRTPNNPLGIYDHGTSLYLDGKCPNSSTEMPKTDHTNRCLESDTVIYKETREQFLTRMTADFNKHLRENPNDIKQWLEFAKFQIDAMDRNDFGNDEKHRKVTNALLLEKQMSIIDRAIENNPKSVELLVYKYNLCKDIWDTDKLMTEWKNVMFLHPNNTWLWKQYLLFFQTQFSAFTITKFTNLYKKCFDMLKKIHDGSFQSHKPLPRMEENMLDIFSKYCQVLYQSGYHERAIANFQALIELNFFTPQHLSPSAPLQDWLAFFEPFWDSGLPRFGEKGALGWSEAMKDKEMTLPVQPMSDESEETVLQENGPKWQNWLNLERFREKHHWLPWKPNELEDECEDPDRMVLFDDVSASLFRIKEEESKFLLLIRFLAILGVQVEPHFESLCRFLGCHDPNFVTDSQEILDDTRHFQWKFYSSDRSSRMFSLEPLFDPTTKYYEFVAQVFQQSVSLLKGVQKQLLIHLWIRHLCHLAGQSRNTNLYKVQLKETKKVIKNFLKLDENRNNLSLWTEYATLEWQCKNYDESRKIFDLALTTYFQTYGQWSKMTHEQRTSLCNVFKVYTELELGIKLDMSSTNSESKDTKVRALSILLHLGSDEKYVPYSKSCGEISPALILKAKFQYKTVHEMLLRVFDNEELTGDKYQLQDSLEGMQQNLLIDWTVCYGLFEYLTDGLRAASDIFENTLQHLTIFSENIANNEAGTSTELRNWCDSEILYMHYVEFHVFHNNTTPSAPLSTLRNVLSKALEHFPENRHFQNLLLDIEAKSHIARRLRTYYNAQLKDNLERKCGTAIFAVISELERQKNLMDSVALATEMNIYDTTPSLIETGITHRLRTLFEKMITHHNLRHCTLIWRLYIKYEMMRSGGKNAKAVLYRALQQCPWAKVLYLDAVQHFPEDIQEINDILVEKEIRMRVPLEEIDLLMGTNEKVDYDDVQNSENVEESAST